MCGVAALYAYGSAAPPVDAQELQRIREAMLHRGPDGAGTWISPDGRAGLAHRRLAIIDLSDTGAQPMASEDGALRISLNGEIYNYRELRRELEAKGRRFRSASDTEVLLHLYAERGADMVHALRGMFAFALWDERRRGLLLARDPFGIKPLYYADDGATVRAASQVKALLKGGAVPATPEPAGHAGFLLWGHVPEPYTLYKGIRALPAGTTLWIDARGRGEPKRYFDMARELARAEDARVSCAPAEMRERLRAALLDSVRYHMVADVPVGVFLSAGLDSSTIAALAKETSDADLQSVTLGFREFEGTQDDEVPYAGLVARHYGIGHQSRRVTREDFQSEYARLLDRMDQPSIDGVNSYFVSRAAANAGLKVALSGLGGDELFAGYPSFRQIPALVAIARPLAAVPSLGKAFRWVSAAVLKRFTSPKYAGLLEYGGSYGGAYLLRRGMYMPWELPELLDADMAREGWQELQTLPRLAETIEGVRSPRLKVTALETAWYMRNQLLRDTDWASMAHSLEVRVPFVDVELFRAAAPLLAGADAPGKTTMASVAAKPLPAEILQRKKTGFTIPVADWLAADRAPAHRGLREWAIQVHREFAGPRRPVAVVFRTGQLGDTLMAVPAIRALRQQYPAHRFVLLTDRQADGSGFVSAWDVCRPTGWFERALFYEADARGRDALREWRSLLRELRALKVDLFFNLAPGRTAWQAARDAWFFRGLGGVRHYHSPVALRTPEPGRPEGLQKIEEEWRYTLRSVSHEIPDCSLPCLPIAQAEREAALHIARANGVEPGAPLLAMGPGSKMSAKRWPAERFAELGRRLLGEYPDLRLVVMGGGEDAALGDELCRSWGDKARNLAGKLTVYGSGAVLEKCVAYVGNDTGTMHLAAMVGIPCVAIFSARDFPGRWDPYGKGHIVLRHEVECAGCLLKVCVQHDNKCLKLISVDEAFRAACRVLADRARSRLPSAASSH